MVQNRRSVGGAILMPSPGTSRSTKVRTNSRRHAMLSASVLARKDRGNPPRHQSLSARRVPTSSSEKPPSSWYAIRPARVSEDCLSRSGEALPSTRNRHGRSRRSASTRSVRNSSGRCCISSMMTSPRSAFSARRGSESRATSSSFSRSKYMTGPRRRSATSRASVDLPTCRAPSIPTTTFRRRSLSNVSTSRTRAITAESLP
jgi:hypothetical protein